MDETGDARGQLGAEISRDGGPVPGRALTSECLAEACPRGPTRAAVMEMKLARARVRRRGVTMSLKLKITRGRHIARRALRSAETAGVPPVLTRRRGTRDDRRRNRNLWRADGWPITPR